MHSFLCIFGTHSQLFPEVCNLYQFEALSLMWNAAIIPTESNFYSLGALHLSFFDIFLLVLLHDPTTDLFHHSKDDRLRSLAFSRFFSARKVHVIFVRKDTTASINLQSIRDYRLNEVHLKKFCGDRNHLSFHHKGHFHYYFSSGASSEAAHHVCLFDPLISRLPYPICSPSPGDCGDRWCVGLSHNVRESTWRNCIKSTCAHPKSSLRRRMVCHNIPTSTLQLKIFLCAVFVPLPSTTYPLEEEKCPSSLLAYLWPSPPSTTPSGHS